MLRKALLGATVTDGRRVQITVWLYKSGHADKNHASDEGVA